MEEGNGSRDKTYYFRIEDAYSGLDEAGIPDYIGDLPVYALMARADNYDINNLTPAYALCFNIPLIPHFYLPGFCNRRTES